MIRSLEARYAPKQADPDSWDGADNDEWRREMLRRNDEARGWKPVGRR
jgi:hypothetical protein